MLCFLEERRTYQLGIGHYDEVICMCCGMTRRVDNICAYAKGREPFYYLNNWSDFQEGILPDGITPWEAQDTETGEIVTILLADQYEEEEE